MFFPIWAVGGYHINVERTVIVDEKLLQEQEKSLGNYFKLGKIRLNFEEFWNNFGTATSCAFLKYSATTSVIPKTQVPQDTALSNLREC
jgi:hypothetical protein